MDRTDHLRNDPTHGARDRAVFLIDQAKEWLGREAIQMLAARIRLLGWESSVIDRHGGEHNMGLGEAQPACYNLVDVHDA